MPSAGRGQQDVKMDEESEVTGDNTTAEVGEVPAGFKEPKASRLNVDGRTVFLTLAALLIFGLMSLAVPETFPTVANLDSMAFQLSEVGILTVGMTLAILIGGIDLSVTAMANLSAIVAGLVLLNLVDANATPERIALAMALAILAAILVGLVCGYFNGLLIGRVGVPAILATLSTLMLYSGLGVGITEGKYLAGFPEQLLNIGIGKVLGIPTPLVIFAAVVVIVNILLNYSAFGFKIHMLGSNAVASRFSGIDNSGTIIRTHMIVGLLSAITGIVTLARTNSANAAYGNSYLLMTVLVAVLGGVSILGGYGRLTGVVLALLCLQMMSSGFNMLLVEFRGSNFFRDFSWGLFLLFAMVVSYFSDRGGMQAFWRGITHR